MIKIYSVILIVATMMMSAIGLKAQTWSSVKSQPGVYYYGEGWGDTPDEADRQALQNLMSQIKMNISVSTKQLSRVEQEGNLVADNNLFEQTFNSYGQATLENTYRIDLEQAPNCHVARYIKRADVQKLWEGRRLKIHEMVDAADTALEKGKVDVALRNYYWALCLLQSMQQSGSESYNGHTLMPWLRERIDDVLSDIKVSATERTGDVMELMFTYQGKRVPSLDFTFNDCGFWSNLCSVRDGIGAVEIMPDNTADRIDLQIETAYKNQTQHDPELQSVVNAAEEIKFRKAALQVKVIGEGESAASSLQRSETAQTRQSTGTAASGAESFTTVDKAIFKRPAETDGSQLKPIMAKIEQAVKSKDTESVRPFFTDEAFGIFKRLVRYGNAKVVGGNTLSFMPFGENTWARGMQLSFSFRNGVRKNFTENVVFTFNDENKVQNVGFGLDKTSDDDIMGRSVFPEECRKILVDFIENYQTAFALKRIDFIEKIFDDDALIIVGKVLRSAGNSRLNDGIRIASGERYAYNRMTKQQYIENLKRCFNSNEYVNLRFNKVAVRKAPAGGEIYGIQLEQDYYSSNYSDHGYLFLEVNLNNRNEPLILVRTWQPNPDPDFGIYDVDSFTIREFDSL